jgi:hypothetical protein
MAGEKANSAVPDSAMKSARIFLPLFARKLQAVATPCQMVGALEMPGRRW